MTRLRAAAALASALLCASCATGVDGTPVAELWDPCTIPDAALVREGIDPEDINPDVTDQGEAQWKTCSWRKDWFYLTIHSTTYSLDAVRTHAAPDGLRDIDIAGRPAFLHIEHAGTGVESCFVSFATTRSAVEVEVSDSLDVGSGDLCATAVDSATRLESELPE